MSDELKRYTFTHEGIQCHTDGDLVDYQDAAAAIEQLQAQLAQATKALTEEQALTVQLQNQLAQAREQADEFRNAYQRLFDRRAMRVGDLKIKVWEALNRRACPAGFMHIATEAIMDHGCGEIADLKKALETKDAELQQARDQVDSLSQLQNMLILCGEPECVNVEGFPQKLRALIDGVIRLRERLAGAMEFVPVAEVDLQDREEFLIRVDRGPLFKDEKYCFRRYQTHPEPRFIDPDTGKFWRADCVTHICRVKPITPPPSNPAEREP